MSRQNSKLASPESSVIVTSSYWKRETKEVSNIYYSFFVPNIEGTPRLHLIIPINQRGNDFLAYIA